MLSKHGRAADIGGNQMFPKIVGNDSLLRELQLSGVTALRVAAHGGTWLHVAAHSPRQAQARVDAARGCKLHVAARGCTWLYVAARGCKLHVAARGCRWLHVAALAPTALAGDTCQPRAPTSTYGCHV